MENITYFREAVEKLASDEKIDDGQYLEMMNRLKVMFEREEKSERKEDRPVVVMMPPQGIPDVPANTRHLSGVYLRHHFMELSMSDFPDCMETWEGLCELGEDMMEWESDGYISYWRTSNLSTIPDVVLFGILRRGVSVWKDLKKWEALLSHPIVRTKWLNEMLRHRTCDATLSKAYRAGRMTETDWTHIFHRLSIPLYTSMEKRRNGECVPRDPTQLQKYHPITLSLNLPNHPIELRLYTDKIQLGRTYLTPSLCVLMLEIVKAERWDDVPLEKILNGGKMFECEKPDYPKMVVSGITAHTRDKRRTYVCAKGLISLTYQTKYSERV